MSAGPQPPPATAALLVIGDEVLTGKTRDENTYWLARELYALGVRLERVMVIPDRIEVIGAATRELSQAFGVVFTSGGVGPTHDDVTYAGVAAAFGLPLVRHPELVARMRAHYADRVNEARLKMADVPSPDELCFDEGMLTPVVRVRNVYILPGVPVLFRQLFGGLRERFRGRPVFLGQILTLQAEGDLAAALNLVVARYPQVRFGSYPRLDRAPYRVKLVVESDERASAEQAMAELAAGLVADQIVEQRAVTPVSALPE